MKNVLFVAPYVAGNTWRCLKLLSEMSDVRLGVISHQRQEEMPPLPGAGLQGHYQIKNVLDPDQLTEAGKAFQREWGRVDRLIGFMEQMQLPNAIARDRLGIEGMGARIAQNFREKNRMKAVLRTAGLPVARQKLLTHGDDALRFADEVGYPIVLKPPAGVGSKGTMRVRSREELLIALNRLLPSEQSPVQAEEFVQGSEHTFETVTVNGAPVWRSSSYYLPGPLQVLENPWIQYCVLLPRETLSQHSAPFAPMNANALAALGMHNGLSHMEWFIRPDGEPVISEVGARPPGVHLMPMMGLSHGVDMWEKWLRLMVHDTFTMPARQYATGCAFFRAQGSGRTIQAVSGLEAAQEAVGDLVVEATLPKVGHPRTDHYEGEGWAIVRHPDTQTVISALKHLISTVRVHAG